MLFLTTFLKMLTEKLHFLARVIFGRPKMVVIKKYQGDPLVGEVVKSLRFGEMCTPQRPWGEL